MSNSGLVVGVPNNGGLASIALNTSSGEIAVGGGFSMMNGTTAAMVARFNGTAWNGVSGLWSTYNPVVYGLAYDSTNENLYIAGTFDTGCNKAAKYSNGAYQCLGNGLGLSFKRKMNFFFEKYGLDLFHFR